MSKGISVELTYEELKLISDTLKHSTEFLKTSRQEEASNSVTDKIDKIFNSIKILREKAKEAKKNE